MTRTATPQRLLRSCVPMLITVVAVLIASLLVNSGKPAVSRPAKAVNGHSATVQPLVTRIIDDLRAGREPPSADNPVAGAVLPITAVKGTANARLGRIEIPAIKLSAVFYDGVTANVLALGPGHWPGTPLPGDPGNSVLSGHRTTHSHPFLNLDRLRVGSVIRISLANRQLTYSVLRITTVPEAKYVPFVVHQPANPDLRLLTFFACTPKHSHRQRIVVQAGAVGKDVISPREPRG